LSFEIRETQVMSVVRCPLSVFEARTYREKLNPNGLFPFQVTVKETDLWVCAEKMLEDETRDLVLDCRRHIESYIDAHPEFASSLSPLAEDPYAPPIVRQMMASAIDTGVGPMASVAGAVAEYVGRGLLRLSEQVIVENGGDIFLKTNRPATISIFAGESSPFSNKLGLKIPVRHMPLGICSSSAKIGHSLSFGSADVCCILSTRAALADSAATALCNRVRNKKDLERVAEWASQVEGLIGGVVCLGDRISAWGDVELVNL
jgi:uncharacterized protein